MTEVGTAGTVDQSGQTFSPEAPQPLADGDSDPPQRWYQNASERRGFSGPDNQRTTINSRPHGVNLAFQAS